MIKDDNPDRGFLTSREIESSRKFLDDGYLIVNAEDTKSLDQIRKKLVDIAAIYLGEEYYDQDDFLNNVHNYVKADGLNEFRMHLIHGINSEAWFRQSYFSVARLMLETLVGNELAMQIRVNLSIQLPGDDSSLTPIHADVWSGDSPFEMVVWLPLVDCKGTKAMFLLPPGPAKVLHDNFSQFKGKSSEDIFKEIEGELQWIDIKYGQILIFNQNLPHGNRVNLESETRWSMNCRFKSVFSPYGDKKLGEFFEPVTLRIASRIGMNYQFPD